MAFILKVRVYFIKKKQQKNKKKKHYDELIW